MFISDNTLYICIYRHLKISDTILHRYIYASICRLTVITRKVPSSLEQMLIRPTIDRRERSGKERKQALYHSSKAHVLCERKGRSTAGKQKSNEEDTQGSKGYWNYWNSESESGNLKLALGQRDSILPKNTIAHPS